MYIYNMLLQYMCYFDNTTATILILQKQLSGEKAEEDSDVTKEGYWRRLLI